MLLPYYPHLHQIFTTLSLTSISQPPMNYQIESVNALKFRFFLIFSHFLSTQTTYRTLSLKFHQKKTEDFDYKLCKVHKLTILGG